MRLLIYSALTDSSEVMSTDEGFDVASLSYPEFTMPTQQRDESDDELAQDQAQEPCPNLAAPGIAADRQPRRRDLQLCHPVVRMTFWVDYMYARAKHLSGDRSWVNMPKQANRRMAACCALLRQRLHIVDLPM